MRAPIIRRTLHRLTSRPFVLVLLASAALLAPQSSVWSADTPRGADPKAKVGTTASSSSKESGKASSSAPEPVGWDDAFLRSKREELLGEFNAFAEKENIGRKFKVKTSERFVFVYDVSDAYLEWLSALAAEVGKAFDKFCVQLDLETTAPTEPLTVVVLATREEFDAYAVTLRGPAYLEQENKPIGFFNHRNNRSVLFDMTATEASRVEEEEAASSGSRRGQDDRAFTRRQINREAKAMKARGNSGSNTSTIVHELSHQLAYNHGIFELSVRQPDWVVEGMAMTFEPSNDDAVLGWRFRGVFPVNEGRLRSFVERVNKDDNLSILDEIVRSDDFETQLSIDGYAASWALFYYCYRKKPKELKKYIETIGSRPRRKVYSPEERMAEFEDCFGPVDVFAKPFVRFMRGLISK